MLTWVEINKLAIKHNIKQFRQLVGQNVLLMPVIKSNAYGHGFLEVAKILHQEKQVDRICVVNLDEAIKLIKNKLTRKPIQILSFFEWNDNNIKIAIKNNVIFPIYSLDYAKRLNKLGEQLKMKIKIAIKIDTGASRIGFLPAEAIENIVQINKLTHLQIEDIFSHFASSEENNTQTKKQNESFIKILKVLEKQKINIPFKHITCSAATVAHPESHFNAVRFGIALYGLHPAQNTKTKINLKSVLSWYTKIIQIKQVEVGSKISYGGTFITKKLTKLAILPIGYFDGYDRGMSNRASVVINGKKCPVRGRICMNLTIVDVSEVGNVKVGDTVTLIGQGITADDLAKFGKTINYEIVSRINSEIFRIVV